MAETIPLFPLAAVLLPGTSLPLHIFEPRYRQLTMDLVNEVLPGRCFGVVAKKPGWGGDVERVDQMREIGCSAVLREVKPLPDGRFDIVTRGDRRFRLLAVDATSAPYLLGVVEWLPDTEPTQRLAALLPSLAASTRAAHRRYCKAAWQRGDWSEPAEDVPPSELAHLVAADCLLDARDRQSMLEETCPARRLRMARQLINVEAAILSNLRAVPLHLSDLDQREILN
ncbi:MAG TPA: LON peptidase substrate-binding domain-containing protein [Pseudonocardiaceae bacterium]|nr:LON peptidase substrate-binding domain-containing protein [Pseudonocardiaceae bacterium]